MKTVTEKAVAGAVWLLLLLALILFWSAGSIRFWQGWLYWIVFCISVITITIYFLKRDPDLVARRTIAGPTAEPATIQKVIQAIASVLFCALLIVPDSTIALNGRRCRFHLSSSATGWWQSHLPSSSSYSRRTVLLQAWCELKKSSL